jgi:hypothetical protein
VRGGVFVAGTHVDIEAQARARHPQGVVHEARPAGLGGVVGDLRAFLLSSVDGLHGDVDIEHPRRRRHGVAHALGELASHPGLRRGDLHALERAAHAALRHHATHAEELRRQRVVAQRREVRESRRPAQDAENKRAEDVANRRRVRTRVRQRSVRAQPVEQSARL